MPWLAAFRAETAATQLSLGAGTQVANAGKPAPVGYRPTTSEVRHPVFPCLVASVITTRSNTCPHDVVLAKPLTAAAQRAGGSRTNTPVIMPRRSDFANPIEVQMLRGVTPRAGDIIQATFQNRILDVTASDSLPHWVAVYTAQTDAYVTLGQIVTWAWPQGETPHTEIQTDWVYDTYWVKMFDTGMTWQPRDGDGELRTDASTLNFLSELNSLGTRDSHYYQACGLAKVRQLQIAPGVTLPSSIWVQVWRVADSFYMQAPIWMP